MSDTPTSQANPVAAWGPASLYEGWAVVKLATPIALGMISGVLLTMIDAMMVAELGTDTIAAAGLASSAFIVINSAALGFVAVIGVHVAKCMGAGEKAATEAAAVTGMSVGFLVSLLGLAAMLLAGPVLEGLAPNGAVKRLFASYWSVLAFAIVPHVMLAALRSIYNGVERPWFALGFSGLALLLNVPLNLLFIHGFGPVPALGLTGAGIASALAKLVTLLLMITHWRLSKQLAHVRSRGRKTPLSILDQLRDGAPVALGSLGEGSAYALSGMLMSALGAVALAAHHAAHSVGVVFYMVPISFMIASSIRTARCLGANQTRLISSVWIGTMAWMAVWSLVVFLFLLATREWFVSRLLTSSDARPLALALFLLVGFTHYADSLQSVALGVLRGLSDNAVPNLISVLSYWVIALPLAAGLGLGLGFGAVGIMSGYTIGVLVAAAVLHLRLARRLRLLPHNRL